MKNTFDINHYEFLLQFKGMGIHVAKEYRLKCALSDDEFESKYLYRSE